MRPVSARQDEPEKPKSESIDDRDERLEERFTYDREGERSTPAYVSLYRERLVIEFMEWREREYQLHRTTGEGIFDGLRRWEVYRFGSQLDNGPHGILHFHVRCQLAPEHGGRILPSPDYLERSPRPVKGLPGGVEAAAQKLARSMSMPRGPSRRQTDERLMTLNKQADGLRLDVDEGQP